MSDRTPAEDTPHDPEPGFTLTPGEPIDTSDVMTPPETEEAPEEPQEAAEDDAKDFAWGKPLLDLSGLQVSSVSTGPTDLVAQFHARVVKALSRVSMGDQVDFGVGLTIVPQQNGFAPALVLNLAMASPLIGQKISNVALIPNLDIDESATEDQVGQMLEGIRQARSEMTAQANGFQH